MKALEFVKAATFCLDSLKASGLELEELTDFDAVEQLIEDMEKPYLTPILAPNNNDFTEETAFWLAAWDGTEPVILIGAKLEVLDREPVDKYWIRTSRRHYPSSTGETLSAVAPQAAQELYGRLAYIGDLYVRPQNRGSLAVLEKFMLMAQLLVAMRWDPDFTYAFMRDRDVRLGFANRYGFTKHLPSVREWSDPPMGRSNSEWLVTVSRSDRDHVIQSFVQSTNELRIVENKGVPPRVANG